MDMEKILMNEVKVRTDDHNKNTVSVIIPVFNREKFVAQALDSVLAQTFKNFEIVVVDDGSTDSSFSILTEYKERFPDKVVLLQQSNSGPSLARNKAIMAAQGKYIAFLDSDDLWPPEKLERQLSIFEEHEDIAFVYSGYYTTNKKGEILAINLPDPQLKGRIYDELWVIPNNICGGTLMVEKEKLLAVGLFDTDLGGGENLDLRIRLSQLGNVYYCSDPLYFYQRHSESLTSNFENMYSFQLKLLEKHFGKSGERNKKIFKILRSQQLYFLGGDLLRSGNCVKAATNFFQSILLYPQRPRAYVNLLRCCMGSQINNWFLSLKSQNKSS